MTGMDTTADRSPERLFRLMMWGFLFFITVPMPIRCPLPDAVGWLVLLVALTRLEAAVPGGPGLARLAMAGLALSLGRNVAALSSGPTADAMFLGLFAATSAVALVLVWLLCGKVAAVGHAVGADALAAGAAFRRVLYAVATVLPFGLWLLPAKDGLAYAGALVATLLLIAVSVSHMMGLMASAARACAHAAANAANA